MLACVFPGQGAQSKGIGKDLFDKIPLYKVLEDDLDRIAGFSIRDMCLNADADTLKQTNITQPCLYVVNALHWEEAKAAGKTPAFLAGHSLGEYNALFAANSFDLQTGLYLVRERGNLMAKAHNGGMAAVLGLPLEKIESVLKDPKHQAIDIANYNTPSQIVISGPKDDISGVEADMTRAGATMFIPLSVGAAFHSRYMAKIANEFSRTLQDVHFRAPAIPVVSNATARTYPDNATSDEIAALLSQQISSPVQWDSSIAYLRGAGVSEFKEIGPGSTLTRMIAQIPIDHKPRALPSQHYE
jgi:malonyl CoA-acyl carrier protein transacylase